MTNFNAMNKADIVQAATDMEALIKNQEERLANRTPEEAFAIIGEQLYDHGRVWNREVNDFIDGNKLGWAQEQILNAMCYSLNRKLEYFEDTFATQANKIEKERKASLGGEIDLRNIAKLQERLEQKGMEVEIINNLYESACDVYEVETGVKFHIVTTAERQAQAKARGASMNPDLGEIDKRAAAATARMAAIKARRAA